MECVYVTRSIFVAEQDLQESGLKWIWQWGKAMQILGLELSFRARESCSEAFCMVWAKELFVVMLSWKFEPL